MSTSSITALSYDYELYSNFKNNNYKNKSECLSDNNLLAVPNIATSFFLL